MRCVPKATTASLDAKKNASRPITTPVKLKMTSLMSTVL